MRMRLLEKQKGGYQDRRKVTSKVFLIYTGTPGAEITLVPPNPSRFYCEFTSMDIG